MQNNNNNKNILKSSSFTLIELIIVLAIISILVTILIATIKPTEIFKKTRDNKRIADLKNIEKTIDLLYSTYPNFNELNYASTNIVYISLKDDSPTCSSYISQLPSLPSGYQYRCSANPQNIDGTGWIPIPFNNFDIINLANLPIDPINKPPYYYTFVVGGSYAVYTMLEDPKNQASKNDQDNYPHLYSVGTNKRLIDQAQGLVGYWPFDEGTGTIAYDYSRNGNNGTLCNGATCGVQGPTWTTGKIGGALSFDGVDDYVNCNSIPQFPTGSSERTVIAWVYQTSYTAWINHIFHYGNANYNQTFGLAVYNDAKFGAHEWSIYTRYGNVPFNQWVFLAITLSGNTIKKYYQNESLIATHAIDPAPNTTLNSCKIGTRVSPNEYFKGLIDEVRLYNRALSDAEIKALYDATK
jgi:prepilin-type N-terminal cleavage/methylation domain-containing protein